MPFLKAVVLVSLAAFTTFGLLVWKKYTTDNPVFASATSKPANDDDFRKLLNVERIVAVHRWQVEGIEKDLLCVFKAFDKDPLYEGRGIKLSVSDLSGALLYEDRFSEVNRVYQTSALRNLSSQMVVEASYGGSTNFLQMLAYRDGKVVNLIDQKESDFDAAAEVRPQFRAGVSSATEPFQILLTNGVGLASPGRKYTRVYRYKNGRYQRVGEFAQQEIDNYIEGRLMAVTARKEPK